MKFKRNLYMIIIAIILYFSLSFIYNNFVVKSEFIYVYGLTKDVSRGDIINKQDFNKVKISTDNLDNYINKLPQEGYYKDDYESGTIMLINMVLSKEEYIRSKENTEVISIQLDTAEDAVSYQISKGNIVNIFYSAKLMDIKNIYNSINKESIISNNLENGYVTIKLLDNIEILNCYDKNGNVTKKGAIAQTILVEVSKDEIVKINNLKNYGKFSISIIR